MKNGTAGPAPVDTITSGVRCTSSDAASLRLRNRLGMFRVVGEWQYVTSSPARSTLAFSKVTHMRSSSAKIGASISSWARWPPDDATSSTRRFRGATASGPAAGGVPDSGGVRESGVELLAGAITWGLTAADLPLIAGSTALGYGLIREEMIRG